MSPLGSEPPIPEKLSEASRRRRENATTRKAGEFVKGPIPVPSIAKAGSLRGRALLVYLAVLFRHGIDQRKPVVVSPALLRRFGIENRKAGYRGLRALELAGLVQVERRRGRCPRATVTEVKR